MSYKAPIHEKLANQINEETAANIERKYKISMIGSGGSMMEDVKVLALKFNCYRSLSFEESHELAVKCIQDYILSVNENEKIRQYLHNYPFEAKNIDIMIFFYQDKCLKKINPGNVSCVSAINGSLCYSTKHSLEEYTLDVLHEETYEEALRIVKEQGSLEVVR